MKHEDKGRWTTKRDSNSVDASRGGLAIVSVLRGIRVDQNGVAVLVAARDEQANPPAPLVSLLAGVMRRAGVAEVGTPFCNLSHRR